MNIGQASAASGVSAKMLRYYESIGLLPRAARTEAGYRVYSAKDVSTLRFIRRARDLGLSIERIKLLVGLWKDRERSSADVKRVAQEHVAELNAKILELAAMRDTLQELADACHGDHRPECPILHDLEGGAQAAESRVDLPNHVSTRKRGAAGLPGRWHAGEPAAPVEAAGVADVGNRMAVASRRSASDNECAPSILFINELDSQCARQRCRPQGAADGIGQAEG